MSLNSPKEGERENHGDIWEEVFPTEETVSAKALGREGVAWIQQSQLWLVERQ